MVASLFFVLQSGLMLYSLRNVPQQAAVWDVFLPLLAAGVAGLVVFSPRNLAARLDENVAVQPPIPGDGTNAVMDKMIWVLAFAGYVFGSYQWRRWAVAERLEIHSGLFYFLEILFASLVVALVHELGHAIVGKALGMKLRTFIIGPFQWHIRGGKWEFQFLPAKIFVSDGATGVVPTTLEHFRANTICMIAAGPFASLIGGLLAFCAAFTAPNSRWEPAWQLLALITTLSLLASILNLIPVRTGTSYSDGAQIYQLLSNGPWGDYHRALSIARSTLVTPLGPRDYDIEAIQRAAISIAHGPRVLHLHLLASSYYLDWGRIPEAIQALAQAEAIYEESASEIPVEWHTEFVFGKALLQRDAAGARLWWDRMEAKKPSRFNGDYWVARSALLWSENHLQEAEEAWQKGYALAQQLPKAGAYEFDRDRFALLRKVLDESLSARQAQALPATTG
jgi:Zn-dependent protease